MYQYRQILVRMRRGDSDREIARSKGMRRQKLAQLRAIAKERNCLASDSYIPDELELSSVHERR